MKYRKRVFGMEERELRAAMNLLMPERAEEMMGAAGQKEGEANLMKAKMQEELVQWLLSEGLSPRHEFLLYREDTPTAEGPGQEPVWLLSRRTRGCPCCEGQGGWRQFLKTSPSPSPCPSPSPRPPSTAPKPSKSPASVLPMKNQTVAVVFRRPPNSVEPNNSPKRPTELPKNGPKTTKNEGKVVTEQPMPGTTKGKEGKGEPEKKKSFGEECCIECGHFCVDLISTLK